MPGDRLFWWWYVQIMQIRQNNWNTLHFSSFNKPSARNRSVLNDQANTIFSNSCVLCKKKKKIDAMVVVVVAVWSLVFVFIIDGCGRTEQGIMLRRYFTPIDSKVIFFFRSRIKHDHEVGMVLDFNSIPSINTHRPHTHTHIRTNLAIKLIKQFAFLNWPIDICVTFVVRFELFACMHAPDVVREHTELPLFDFTCAWS